MTPDIWRVGTRHVLRVKAKDDDENQGLTPQIRRVFESDFQAAVYGDYEVCPMNRNIPGRMQFVCMVSASKLVVVPSELRNGVKP